MNHAGQKRGSLFIGGLLGLIWTVAVAGSALAEVEEIIPPGVAESLTGGEEGEEAIEEGWSVRLNLGATAFWGDSRRVVGQADGLTTQLGTVLGGSANWRSGRHRWENGLLIEQNQSRSPVLDRFIKSADNLELQSMYTYRFARPEWAGAYARGRLYSHLFPGYLVMPDDVEVTRDRRDGEVTSEVVEANNHVDLTGSFEPLLLSESVGLSATPVEGKRLSLRTGAGLGAQHIIVRDGFVGVEGPADGNVELRQLTGSNSLGVEWTTTGASQLADNLQLTASASFFYPVATTADGDLEGVDKLHSEVGGGLSVKLSRWLSLEYQLRARRLPFIVNQWQVQNTLLLSTGFTII